MQRQHPLTFVSAFLDLQEDRSKDKSVERCFDLFRQLAATGIPIHLFLSRCYESRLQPSPTLHIEYIELRELNTHIDLLGADYELPQNRTAHHDTTAFMTLMNAKSELVGRAVETAAFGSTHYAWIDFSIFHVFRQPAATAAYLKQLATRWLPSTCFYMPGCWGPAVPGFDAVSWRFCGGFFLGDAVTLARFAQLYRDRFRGLVAQYRRLSWEVNVWAYLEATGAISPTWFKADHNDSIVQAPIEFPVVASMTTIPPRLATDCRLAIDSLLGQVDCVYLSVAKRYKRFGDTETELPAYLQEEPYRSRVEVVMTEDFGPATKYLGALARIPATSWIFFCDDDQEYAPNLIALMQSSVTRLGAYQNHFQNIRRKTSGGMIHGYVGNMIHASLLTDLPAFALPDCARFVDDQWLSAFCFLQGIPVFPTAAETYAQIFKVLDGWHEKLGSHALSGLHNREEKVREIENVFGLKFIEDGRIIGAQPAPPPQ
jgi:hypothetical protein